MNRITQLKTVQEEAAKLFERKNKDYGDAFANYGPIGVIVRMGDKINRLSSVTNNGINLVKTESIRDTLIDLHNYSAMAIMLMDEDKKDISQNRYLEMTLTLTNYLFKIIVIYLIRPDGPIVVVLKMYHFIMIYPVMIIFNYSSFFM